VKIYAAAVETLREMEIGHQNRMKLSLAQKEVHFLVLFFSFGTNEKNLLQKETRTANPRAEERHHALGTLINEALQGPS
jgi:hypothetical protein